MRLSREELSPQIREQAESLSLVLHDEHIDQDDILFFALQPRSTVVGRKVIELTYGSASDGELAEGWSENVILTFNRRGNLLAAQVRSDFEPAGPVLQPPRLLWEEIFNRLMEKLVDAGSSFKCERRNEAAYIIERLVSRASRCQEQIRSVKSCH